MYQIGDKFTSGAFDYEIVGQDPALGTYVLRSDTGGKFSLDRATIDYNLLTGLWYKKTQGCSAGTSGSASGGSSGVGITSVVGNVSAPNNGPVASNNNIGGVVKPKPKYTIGDRFITNMPGLDNYEIEYFDPAIDSYTLVSDKGARVYVQTYQLNASVASGQWMHQGRIGGHFKYIPSLYGSNESAWELGYVPNKVEVKDECKCNSRDMANFGCQCGYVKRRRAAGKSI